MKKLLFITVIPFLVSCQTMQTVDKTIYDITDSVSSQDSVTGERTLNFDDRNTQIQKAAQFESQILTSIKNDGGLINDELDEQAYERVKLIAERVLSVSHFSNETWNIYLLPDESFNAFVTGGNSIFVNIGLLKYAETDDEIAAVLGHEIAHNAASHSSERQAQLISLRLAGSNSVRKDGYVESYGTKQEEEADMVGVLYMSLAGYDPYASVSIWEKLSSVRDKLTFYYETHPKTTERAINNEKFADAVAQYYEPNKINPNSNQLIECNVLWCKQQETVAAGQGGGFLAALSTVLDAYVDHHEAKLEKQKQELEMQQTAARLNIIGKLSDDARISGSVYYGYVTFDNSDSKIEIATQFIQDKNGYLSGAYQYHNGNYMVGGQLEVTEIDHDNGIAYCNYFENNETGKAAFQFSSDGSQFRGSWKRSDATVQGEWNGELRF